MKQKNLHTMAFALAMIIFSGCGKTVPQSEPTNINQAMLIEKSAQEQESYTFPETFTGDWTSQQGRLTIHADAKIVAEQGTVLPTATVEPRTFTQEDVDNLLRVFLKGEPLYSYTQTKQELKEWIDHINSPEWEPDPDAPEPKEEKRKRLNAEYEQWVKTAPEEKPIIHGFYDSDDPKRISGSGTVDGIEYDIGIFNQFGGSWTAAYIERTDYKYGRDTKDWGGISEEEAIAQGDALMQELGFDHMVLDDIQPSHREDNTWQLYYTPTVNGIPISSIRQDIYDQEYGRSYQYETYSCSEEVNPDTVSWVMEAIWITVGKDGILSFTWDAPATNAKIQTENSNLLPFEEIAAIADTMLPVVIIGPSEARSLVEIDAINGYETRMDVEITKVSLTLMRVRDKGSLQGTVVPVWDFWGTSDWYDAAPNAYGYNQKGERYSVEPLMTLNAIDGTVVSRLFGY